MDGLTRRMNLASLEMSVILSMNGGMAFPPTPILYNNTHAHVIDELFKLCVVIVSPSILTHLHTHGFDSQSDSPYSQCDLLLRCRIACPPRPLHEKAIRKRDICSHSDVKESHIHTSN